MIQLELETLGSMAPVLLLELHGTNIESVSSQLAQLSADELTTLFLEMLHAYVLSVVDLKFIHRIH